MPAEKALLPDVKLPDVKKMLSDFSAKMEKAANAPDAWWNHIFSESINWEGDKYNTSLTGFFYIASRSGRKIFEFNASAYKLKIKENQDEIINDIIKEFELLNIPCIYESNFIKDNKKNDIFYSSEEVALSVIIKTSQEEKIVSVNAVSFDDAIIKKIKNTCLFHFDLSHKTGDLFTVSEDSEGPNLVSLGTLGVELERNNYSKDVLDNYDYVVKQFSSTDPFGRLVIVHGPPGTGKTRMLKSFINDIKSEKNKYIFFQPEFLSRHSISSITRLLMDAVEDYKSITIFIEDADDILVPRQADNMTAISTLLNFADGFIGSMLNLKIIVTTNAADFSIDKALKRAGRLCKIMNVGTLEPEQANKIFERLTNKSGIFSKKDTVLADVYAAAYKEIGKAEIADTEKPPATVGFGNR